MLIVLVVRRLPLYNLEPEHSDLPLRILGFEGYQVFLLPLDLGLPHASLDGGITPQWVLRFPLLMPQPTKLVESSPLRLRGCMAIEGHNFDSGHSHRLFSHRRSGPPRRRASRAPMEKASRRDLLGSWAGLCGLNGGKGPSAMGSWPLKPLRGYLAPHSYIFAPLQRPGDAIKRSSRAWKKRGNMRWKWRKKRMRRRKRQQKMRQR